MKQNKYDDSTFFNKYSNMERSKKGLDSAGEWHELFEDVLSKISRCLSGGGDLVFSVEHPVFTAYGTQDWHYDDNGNHLHWPVDKYFSEGMRETVFLDEKVIKYHRTLTTYLNCLIMAGFEITGVVEPKPAENMLSTIPGMLDELRRPMMLLVSARKK